MGSLGIFGGNYSDGITGYFDYGNNDDIRLFEMGSPASNKLGDNTHQVIAETTDSLTTALTKKEPEEVPYSVPAFS